MAKVYVVLEMEYDPKKDAYGIGPIADPRDWGWDVMMTTKPISKWPGWDDRWEKVKLVKGFKEDGSSFDIGVEVSKPSS